MSTKKLIVLLFAVLIALLAAPEVDAAPASASAPKSVSIYVDGQLLVTKNAAYLGDGSVMVPLRELFTALHLQVAWDERSKTISATANSRSLIMTIDQTKAYSNGTAIQLSSPPIVRNNITYVPLRAVGESTGYKVRWEAARNSAFVDLPPFSEPSEPSAQPPVQPPVNYDATVKIMAPDGTVVSPSNRNVALWIMGVNGELINYIAYDRDFYGIVGLKPGTKYRMIVQINDESDYKAPEPIEFTYDTAHPTLDNIQLGVQNPYRLTARLQNEQDGDIPSFSVELADLDSGTSSYRNWSAGKGVFRLYDLTDNHRYTLSIMFNNQDPLTLGSYLAPQFSNFTYHSDMTELPALILHKVQVLGKVVSPDGTRISASSGIIDAQGNLVTYSPGRPNGQFAAGGMVAGQSYTLVIQPPLIISAGTVGQNSVPHLLQHQIKIPFVFTESMNFGTIVYDKDANVAGNYVPLSGKVVKADGQPAAGVQVKATYLFNGENQELSVFTDIDGRFTLNFTSYAYGTYYALSPDGASEKVEFIIGDRYFATTDLVVP